jgi:hypothetical protein
LQRPASLGKGFVDAFAGAIFRFHGDGCCSGRPSTA